MKRYRQARAFLAAGVGASLLALWSALAIADRETFTVNAESVAIVEPPVVGSGATGTVDTLRNARPQTPQVKRTHTRTRAS